MKPIPLQILASRCALVKASSRIPRRPEPLSLRQGGVGLLLAQLLRCAAALASKVCGIRGWHLQQTRFYTGMPDLKEDPDWHAFWSAKKTSMIRQGIEVFTRTASLSQQGRRVLDRNVAFRSSGRHSLAERHSSLRLERQGNPARDEIAVSRVGEEKGIDIRIALDIISMAREKAYEAAIIFSQDQDLSEVAKEVKAGREVSRGREIKLASCLPDRLAESERNRWDRLGKNRQDHLRCVHRHARLSSSKTSMTRRPTHVDSHFA